MIFGLEISRPKTKSNRRPKPMTWPSLLPVTSDSWSRPRSRTFMLSLRTPQGQVLTILVGGHPHRAAMHWSGPDLVSLLS